MQKQTVTLKGNWSGIVSIDIVIKGSRVDEEAIQSATKTLQDEMSVHIKEAIMEVIGGLPDGGSVRISDVCIEPFQVINDKELTDGD